MTRLAIAVLLLPLVLLVSGCPAVVVGGGAAAYSAFEDRRTSGTMMDDDNIEGRLANALRARYGDNTHVNVTSYNRMVLLTGEVPDDARRAEIEKLVKDIGSVRGVTNDLQLGPPSSLSVRTNDSLITTKVKGRLLDSAKVNPVHVKVVTEAGVVYLMGIVTEKEASDAVEVARTTGGVIKVVRIFELCKAGDGVCPPAK
jgi:osmotically-inducible protein OsmY